MHMNTRSKILLQSVDSFRKLGRKVSTVDWFKRILKIRKIWKKEKRKKTSSMHVNILLRSEYIFGTFLNCLISWYVCMHSILLTQVWISWTYPHLFSCVWNSLFIEKKRTWLDYTNINIFRFLSLSFARGRKELVFNW